MSSPAIHIDPASIASAVVRELMDSKAGIERLAMQSGRLLYWADVKELTQWGDKKLQAMIDEGIMPMVKPEGKWFITWQAYERAINAYYSAHLPKRRYRKISDR